MSDWSCLGWAQITMKGTSRKHFEWSSYREMGNAWGHRCSNHYISCICTEMSHCAPPKISAIVLYCREQPSGNDSCHLHQYSVWLLARNPQDQAFWLLMLPHRRKGWDGHWELTWSWGVLEYTGCRRLRERVSQAMQEWGSVNPCWVETSVWGRCFWVMHEWAQWTLTPQEED